MRIAPPFLPPHHGSPATRDFHFSISVEVLLHRCHLDVQGLLHQQLFSSAMVQYSGLLPVDWMVVIHACSTTADFSIMSRQGEKSNRLLTSSDVYTQLCMAINSNVCLPFFYFHLDVDWSYFSAYKDSLWRDQLGQLTLV